MNKKIKGMVFCALFAALIAVGAFLKVPIPVVPFTLQYAFTMLAGLLLGRRLGSLSVIIYVLIGLLGIPVFASGGGIHYVLQPSFGYLIGFIAGTYITGLIAEKAKQLNIGTLLIANFSGLFIVYAMGMIYYYIISNYVIDTPIGLWPLFLYCFLLAVPGDIVLCILCAFLGKKLIPVSKQALEE